MSKQFRFSNNQYEKFSQTKSPTAGNQYVFEMHDTSPRVKQHNNTTPQTPTYNIPTQQFIQYADMGQQNGSQYSTFQMINTSVSCPLANLGLCTWSGPQEHVANHINQQCMQNHFVHLCSRPSRPQAHNRAQHIILQIKDNIEACMLKCWTKHDIVRHLTTSASERVILSGALSAFFFY